MNNSRAPARIQIPCRETCVTSTPEVLTPCGSDGISTFPHDVLDLAKLPIGQADVVTQLDARFQPVLRFSVRGGHVHMHSRLFPRKKKKRYPRSRWTVGDIAVSNTVYLRDLYVSANNASATNSA